MSTQSFAELGVSKAVRDALSQRGITEPFAVQQLVIGDVLAGRDVLVKSPTGSGKTLAFGIPIIESLDAAGPRPAALVLAPTRELASQITEELRAIAHSRALRITAVYGGVGLSKQAAAAAKSHVLVATPGRLEDLLQRGAFALDAVSVLVLDEADRMLDMGFRPAVERIVAHCPRARQTLFFSATLDGLAGRVAREYTTNAIVHEHGPSGRRAAADLEHRFVTVTDDRRVEALVAELEQERDLALVFVRTKRGADRLVKRLDGHGVTAAAIHANKSQRQREQALDSFEQGRIDTLVATDIAARGIDIEGISHVINFDPPDDHDAYVHRVGRTGRAGRSGVGITLVASSQRRDIRELAMKLGIAHTLPGGADPVTKRATADANAPRDGRSRPRRRGRSRRPTQRHAA
jgi:superfamily II DNA/RNA helicase